ncbi:MAG TPA: hypothetical protein VFW23_14180 [Tepidisphaeraceae bacterium]|nr:hypothetical protein [Tepidisphaeraceae bacterium]
MTNQPTSSNIDRAINDFWKWFTTHQKDFDALRDSDSPFWDVALRQLQQLDQRLHFEISRPSDGPREFIVTAEGRRELFEVVERLVAHAPRTNGWQFIALKPPMGFYFTTDYEGIVFDPGQMWFCPLKSKSSPDNLGLRVGVPGLNATNKRQADNAVLVILDTALGERSAASDLQFVETVPLPESPAASGFIELTKLGKYIEFHKRKRKPI